MFSAQNGGLVQASNCSFSEISAIEGAVFVAAERGKISISDSEFRRNYAVASAIGMAELDGQFELNNVTMSENWASTDLLLTVFDSTLDSSIREARVSANS